MDLSDLTWQEGIEIITEGRYAIVAVYALQLYEWLETAPLEVNLIHYSPWSPVKVAYLLCRYYPLVLWPLVMFAYVGNHSWEVCNHLGPPVHILLAPCQLFPQGVMMMRAYAFCGRDKRILVFLLMCITGLLAVDIWAFCTHYLTLSELVFIVIGSTGCFPVYGQGYMGFRVGYSMLAATLVDLMSLVMILIHCARKRTREISLARYFIKQGMISFGLVTAVNVTTAVFFLQPGKSKQWAWTAIHSSCIKSYCLSCNIRPPKESNPDGVRD